MYLPPHFEQADRAEVEALVAAHPFALLVTQREGSIAANPIPFLWEPARGEQGTLVGHVARANPVWEETVPGSEALVVFSGGEAYISPNWYPSKQVTHEAVPTWNYTMVQFRGTPTFHHDEKWLRGAVGKLTTRMERDQPVPWKMADAPRPYMETMLDRIVGIEIPVTSISAKWKLSQNRSDADREGAADGLATSADPGDRAIEALMRATLPQG